jgi:hypothetical protein
MPQLSRPFQIVIVVFVLFAGVWLFALQGRSTTPSSSSASTSAGAVSTTSAPAVATATKTQGSASSHAAGGASHVSHGSGSSLGGLSHAINRAHHAAAVSQQNANQLASKSAQATNEAAPAQSSSAATHTPATASSTAKAPVTNAAGAKSGVTTSSTAASSTAHKSASSPSSTAATAVPSGQRTVEADLTKGDVVVLLFWNPAGTDDVVVHRALQPLSNSHSQKVSVLEATASQVASYGSVTRGVQVYATPTILVIDKQGHAIVLTGIQDAFAVEQAIAEARSS